MELVTLSKRARRLENWTDSFFQFTESLPSPAIFRKWVGIAIIAGALERKVWVRTYGRPLYPNMYTILCGPAGVGKSMLTSLAWDLWAKLEDQFVASTSVTKAALIDDLRDAERNIIRPREIPAQVKFNSLKIASNELGVLIPSYENEFMNTLTDLWDGYPYGERRRSRELKFKLDAPQLNLLAATTPSYLNHVLPEGAWDQGFLARTVIVFSSEQIVRELFHEEELDRKLWDRLVADLRIIGNLYGKMEWTPEAGEAMAAWHRMGGEPKPEHPKLMAYNVRRSSHMLKLCMVACAARGDDLIINKEDFDRALDWLVEAEFFMPDVFKAMTTGGAQRIIEECWYFVYQLWMKEQAPIAEFRIIQFLSERAPIHEVQRILEVMEKATILNKKLTAQGNGYEPRPFRR